MKREADDTHVDAGADTNAPGNSASRYPATIEFASHPSENRELVEDGRRARRPGGALRGVGKASGGCAPHGAPAGTLAWRTASCDGDEGAPHAKADARSPNPTPGDAMIDIGKTVLKGIEAKAQTRLGVPQDKQKFPGTSSSSKIPPLEV